MEIKACDMGASLYYADHGGRGRPMVLVHGLGGSFINWMGVAPRLAERYEVTAPDLVGFGLSEPLGRSSSVQANQQVLDRFIREVAGEPAVLVGNSMGGLVSMMEAVHAPDRVAALVLVDPAVPPPTDGSVDPLVEQLFTAYATPGVGEQMLETMSGLPPELLVEQMLALTCADPSRLDVELVRTHLDHARERQGHGWANPAFLEAARTLLAVLLDPPSFERMVSRIQSPTILIEGELDRLVQLSAARAVADLRPDWTFEVLPGIGHVPMMEDPDGLVELVTGWLDKQGLPSAGDDRPAAARSMP